MTFRTTQTNIELVCAKSKDIENHEETLKMKWNSVRGDLYICVLYLSLTVSQAEVTPVNHDTLKLVQVIFRHGDRVPEHPYPNDPFKNESTWPEGWGQLTSEGKQQMYQLGMYLRERYDKHLSATYVPNQLYVVSSDTDRAFVSALLVVAGLYPVNKESNWNNSINWQPVPVRRIWGEDDNFIGFYRRCPKFFSLYDDFVQSTPMMTRIDEENKPLYENLTILSGVTITSFTEIQKFYTTLFIEDFKGLDIPEWGKRLRSDQHFQYLYNLSFQATTFTPQLQRLSAGELVKHVVTNVEERVQNATMKTRMVMISGHDATLIALLNTFGVFDLHRPWYGSVLMIELHQEPNNGHFFIELHYRNDTSRVPYQLVMPGCEFKCRLDSFLSRTKLVIPDEWEVECQLAEIEPRSAFPYTVVLIGFVAMVVSIMALVCFRSYARRNDMEVVSILSSSKQV